MSGDGDEWTHRDPEVGVRVVVAVDDPPRIAEGGRRAAVQRRQIDLSKREQE